MLLGTTLLFWGAMTGRPGTGLLLALILEASHWTRLRWDFDDAAASKAWKISALGLFVATVLIWLDGNRIDAVPMLLTWLPPLLLPVQFVQAYGLRTSIPLNTFSFFAKQRRERNRKLGLQESVIHFNFGNFYFACCMVAATLGTKADNWVFLLGLVVLTGWILARYTQGSRLAFLFALLIAGLLTLGGHWSLRTLHDRMMGRGGRGSEFDPNFARTAIGNLAEVKQSPDIIWRVKVPSGATVPTLLRTASYNAYDATFWKRIVPTVPGVRPNDFQDLVTVERDGQAYHLLRAEAGAEALRPELPRFQIRGVATARTPLPLPGTAASLTGFDLEGAERNSLGTVRIFPVKAIIDGDVLWQDSANFEIPPLQRVTSEDMGTEFRQSVDLRIPEHEKPVVEQIVAELGLARAATTREKLLILQRWYNANFAYSKYLSIPPSSPNKRFPTEIGSFLTTHRSGHCEYFATSAVLLLRAANVPTRYAIGFSVMEKDEARAEWNLRGIHAHSWCRVWDEASGLWIDFDPTPANWLAMETDLQGSMQWLKDAFQRIREDFFLWRNDPRNRLGAFIVISLIAAAVLAFVARRLWKSRRHVHHLGKDPAQLGPSLRTPLHRLEPLIRKQIGPRPRGQTFANWLSALHLPDSAPLTEAIALHQQLRFDPHPPTHPDPQRLDELTLQLEALLKDAPSAKSAKTV